MQHYTPAYADRITAALRNPRAALSQPRAGERPPLMCDKCGRPAHTFAPDEITPLCAEHALEVYRR